MNIRAYDARQREHRPDEFSHVLSARGDAAKMARAFFPQSVRVVFRKDVSETRN